MGCGASSPAAENDTTATSEETGEEAFKWEEEENDTVQEMSAPEPKPPPMAAMRKKRQSVSAECFTPGQKSSFQAKVVPKTPAERESVQGLLEGNILFKALDEEQLKTVIDAVERKEFSSGANIIEQGDRTADWFYILCVGSCQAFVNGTSVKEYSVGGSFGELALLYNAPRAATVSAMADSTCWALDRATFRSIVVESNALRRRDYEKFLSQVELLSTLDDAERSAIADVMEPKYFDPGSIILKEGDAGDVFYILEDGSVNGVSSLKPDLVTTYKRGDFFGELALLTNKPRQATCTAVTRCKVASMDRDSFDRLLGQLKGILGRNEDKYADLMKSN